MTEATPKVLEAVGKIKALRRLTRESGCITTRTQSKILQVLTPDEMVAVAEILDRESQQ